ncbi:hypothetical protein ES705_45677 [subsurface metagenome]
MKDLIEELEIYRLENKISQKKLAEKLGVSFATVNRWFNKRNTPSKIQTYHINKLLEIYRFKDKHFEIT